MTTNREKIAAYLRTHKGTEFSCSQLAKQTGLTVHQVTEILNTHRCAGRVRSRCTTGRSHVYTWNTPRPDLLRAFLLTGKGAPRNSSTAPQGDA